MHIYVRTYAHIHRHFITTHLYAYICIDIHKYRNEKQVFKEDMLKTNAAE